MGLSVAEVCVRGLIDVDEGALDCNGGIEYGEITIGVVSREPRETVSGRKSVGWGGGGRVWDGMFIDGT